MLILGIDGAKGGAGWTLLRTNLSRRNPALLDLGHFTPAGKHWEARLDAALEQLADVIKAHRVLEEPVLVLVEEPPPTTSRNAKQARIGFSIGMVVGAVCLWAIRQGYQHPWVVPVGEWRFAMGVGSRGMGGAWKAAACRVVMQRWPRAWPYVAAHSSRFDGDIRTDMGRLGSTKFVEKLDKDNACDVAESLLIAEYGVTHQHKAPSGPTRKVRIGIGGVNSQGGNPCATGDRP